MDPVIIDASVQVTRGRNVAATPVLDSEVPATSPWSPCEYGEWNRRRMEISLRSGKEHPRLDTSQSEAPMEVMKLTDRERSLPERSLQQMPFQCGINLERTASLRRQSVSQ